MDNVVYILGAGFSAPLGLPVMRNFLIKSKDMFAEQSEKFSHFKQVFDLINEMSKAKNYFDTNLFNIEEILSIVEMRTRIGQKSKVDIPRYISDVIRHFTPSPFIVLPEEFRGEWRYNLSVGDPRWQPYVYFALSLLGVAVKQTQTLIGQSNFALSYSAIPARVPQAHYSVITLNYDLVLETVPAQMASRMQGGWAFEFQTSFPGSPSFDTSAVPLVKLHGSVDKGQIIAPTWNKAVSKEMEATWQKAHHLLEEANQIRFIGYSLPQADAYIRYLLKSAIINSKHLKNIDVVGPNMTGPNGNNYREFVTFYDARYASATFQDYGKLLIKQIDSNMMVAQTGGGLALSFDRLETVHNEVMQSNR